MDDGEKLNALQELLMEAYVDYVSRHKRKVSDNEFAKYLGVSGASYNQWVNGNRLPSYDSALQLAKKLGPRVFDILGYERIAVSNIPEVMFIAENWRYLDGETRNQIIEHITEEVQKRAGRT